MFKNFFFTIFLSLIFVSFLEASNEKINQQIFELKTSHDYAQKINDEKITLIMGQIIQKENEIKELEKELKEYVNKEDLEREINYQNNRIADINSHVDKLSISVTVVGILITVILLLFTGTFFYVSNKKHLEKVDEWINKNKDKILEPIHKEGNDLLRNIEDKALMFYQDQLKELNLDKKLNENQKQTETEIFNKVNKLLEHKEKEKYTYNDWNSKFLDYYYKERYEDALEAIDNAISKSKNNSELVTALVRKGFILGQLERNNDAIVIYNEVINKFKNDEGAVIKEKVLDALINKIEMNLIENNENNEDDLSLFHYLSKERKENLMKYSMLRIIENAKKMNQDIEIKKWKREFSDTKFTNWFFDELKNWINKYEDEVVKERLLRYIDIFEKHNESVEEN
ncbi:tetratricopeptide repeat protein [Halarcobacter bivalviorum]|uniref:Membrane protein n=1 Tax=Halarcobacter bivalviorum TaxID=663364 RepID=A0AAX2ABS9_9BACT|nr:hypothetical protein [Halarcobacter bivalviorum]AXH11773.1 putative membrane protein [Halarcobacter bivalviorum]RXK10900.1 hypothetical protein CRV05_00580 [Halarcobacter bivalviorum]